MCGSVETRESALLFQVCGHLLQTHQVGCGETGGWLRTRQEAKYYPFGGTAPAAGVINLEFYVQ